MGRYKDSFLSLLYSAFNRPYITPALMRLKRPLLIHISDTPGFVYPYIYRLITKLKPKVLIHTGDFIDDLKLELKPYLLSEYSNKIKKILIKLEKQDIDKIYLVPGNHDNEETVKNYTVKSMVIPEKSKIEIDGFSFFVSHYYHDQKTDTDFYLYGHSLPVINRAHTGTIVMNGIPFINIISLYNGKTHTVKYPPGTDSSRLQLLTSRGI